MKTHFPVMLAMALGGITLLTLPSTLSISFKHKLLFSSISISISFGLPKSLLLQNQILQPPHTASVN
jgi:hypothetical protein